MGSQAPKPSKPSKPNPSPSPSSASSTTTTAPSSRPSSSLSSHLAMIELKQRILNSLSKLSDRDTHQIAVEDLEKIIQTLSPDGIPMLLNCLYEASNDPKPAVKKEALRLLALLCTSHADSTSTHLTKIIAHIVRRLKDSDSAVRDSCRDAIGGLSSQYLRGEGDNGNLGSVVSLFVKPLFEAMGEQNKIVQAGSAMCMARMVECAADPPIASFQKLCPRICKYLNNPNFLAKAALLPVIASLSQVGAISAQSLQQLLQSIHDCLESMDWATRKAAADTLNALASHSKNLIMDGAASTISALEACRFDKVKPVRDSMTEALQQWKKIAEKGDNRVSDDSKANSNDGKISGAAELSKKSNPDEKGQASSAKDTTTNNSPNSGSVPKAKGNSISDKAVGILKKKAPALSDKEFNPEFFQKLQTRGLDDLPVEVVVPRRCLNSSNSHDEEELRPNDINSTDRSGQPGNQESDDVQGSTNVRYHRLEREAAGVLNKQQDFDEFGHGRGLEQRVLRGKDSTTRLVDVDNRIETNQRDSSRSHLGFPRTDGHSDGSFMNNKGNWLAIQRQLSLLERQQAHLMNMLQDFMGGSHDSMVTLENRVRGLERVVEDMSRDLAISSGRRGGNFMSGYEGSSIRPLGKYNGLPDYSSTNLGRVGEGRVPIGERFLPSDGAVRGRDPSWRSNMTEAWDSHTYAASRNGHVGSRRALGSSLSDGRSPRPENDGDQIVNRRAWDKGSGPARLGEGPSARSVWQASKDEATLEAIRVAGDDNGTSRGAKRVAIPELTAEALGDDNMVQERDRIWASWNNAMDALEVGDMDSAYAEVLSAGDDLLLVKLMDRTGPVLDQLSNEVASEILHAVGQFLLDQNLFDICLSWIQQLADIVLENGPDVLGIIPIEGKRELLMNLHEASSSLEPPEDWEGAAPDQLILQLASAWEIDALQIEK